VRSHAVAYLLLGILAASGCRGDVPQNVGVTPTPQAAVQASAVGEDEPWCLPGNAADWEVYQASLEESKTNAGDGPPPNLGELVEKLHSPSPDERLDAIRALGNLGPAAAPAVEELQQALNARHPTVQRGYELVGFQFKGPILWALARIGPAAEPAVDDILQVAVTADPDRFPANYDFQVLAIQALGSIGPGASRAVEPLLQLAEPMHAGDVRLYYTLKAVGSIGGESAWQGLEKYLRFQDRTARAVAAKILAKERPEKVGPVFESFMQDDPEVAVELASLLGFSEKRLDFLLKTLRTDNREKAVEALIRFGPAGRKAVPTLVEMEKEIDREPLARALSSLDPTGELSVPLIRPGLQKEAEVWRTLDLLDRMGTPRARREIEAYLSAHPGAENQLRHVRELRSVGDVGM